MFARLLLSTVVLVSFCQPVMAAAPGSESLEREFQQVRRIALRDPKVRAAYADADRRLEAKMVQIDPALAPYIRSRERTGPAAAGPAPVKRRESAPAAAAKPAPKVSRKSSYVVRSGDTLASIARANRVSVASLRAANQIEDERKLRVGHTLVIPSSSNASPAPAPAKEQSVWDRFGL